MSTQYDKNQLPNTASGEVQHLYNNEIPMHKYMGYDILVHNTKCWEMMLILTFSPLQVKASTTHWNTSYHTNDSLASLD